MAIEKEKRDFPNGRFFFPLSQEEGDFLYNQMREEEEAKAEAEEQAKREP